VEEQGPLDEVVVPRQVEGTAIAEVRDHREPGVDRRAELVERRVAVAGRHRDAVPRQERGGREPRVALRRERDEPHEAGTGLEDPLGSAHGRRHDLRGIVRPRAAGLAAQERPLDVEARDHPGDRGILLAEGREPGELVADALDRVGDHRGEDAVGAVGGELVAGPAALRQREVLRAEVSSGVAVDLDVEAAGHKVTSTTPS
jgi:hypothetical protein